MVVRKAIVAAALAVLSLTVSPTQAADPPLRLVYGYQAGGIGDALIRGIGDKLQASLNRTVIVENKTGADGRVGIMAVKMAQPSGDVLLFTPFAGMSIFPSTYKKLDYDPVTDFAPIAQVASFDLGLAVGKLVPAKDIKELAAWLKANPKQANAGVPGLGSLPHFMVLSFAKAAGAELVTLPFRGSAGALSELIAGNIAVSSTPVADVTEHAKAGRLKLLVTSGATRSPISPDVPTFKESGYDIEGSGWYGLYAPAGTPPAVIAKLNTAVVAAVQAQDMKKRFLDLGLVVTGTTPQQLAQIQKRDREFWAPVIKASGFTSDQ